ncbi:MULTISPECIES: YaiI/YqxD family protein [Bacillus]|uniref:UPF0178 protein AM592_08595 n=2 Tax=Bacillus TaxID=1386 RepID=A0A0M5JBK1_9BACI|nr:MULTISPECIES: YaiI/YqxD family protein [Bacillus]ALC81657.1 hypothetical protein AM592_08595 [Bacillus gobiensis]MBP1080705.1 uncharacterized protein YaiI (UPF0178 family) [Bacillus capparidis]MED1094561.1 YaiI/YqxD family protein [Bacillus capparidis]
MEGWRIKFLDEAKRTIFVDADACPVKDEIRLVASNFHTNILFVASYVHYQQTSENENWKYVDPQKEAVDLFILNHIRAGDIAVTQDIGLASLLLGKHATVISERGRLYHESTIDLALERRYLSQKERRRGVHMKGPKKLVKEDRERFSARLQKILSNNEGII